MQIKAVCALWFAVQRLAANEDLRNDNNLDAKILDKLENLVSCLKQQDERIKELETTAFEQRQYTQQLEKRLKQGARGKLLICNLVAMET